MERPEPRSVVALVVGDERTRRSLQTSLEEAGFSTVSPEPRHVHAGQLDLTGFLDEIEPAVVVCDLAPPYAEGWRALQAAVNSRVAEERHFVLVTTNKAALELALGATEALEVDDRPSGHHELVRTVRRTLEARAQGTAPQ